MTRRDWISTIGIGAAVAVPAYAAEKPVRCTVLDDRGAPVPVEALARFYICDLLLRPSPIDPKFAPGEAVFDPIGKPFRISVPLRVPGFGHVFLYADNRGAGYTSASLAGNDGLLLNYEFAVDRLATVRCLADQCRSSGVVIAASTERRGMAGAELLRKADTARKDRPACARASMESLRESLWAGEELVLERARQRIAKQGPRPGFLFGCNAFQFATGQDWYRERYAGLFNYATLPFYRGWVEQIHGKPDYSAPDAILNAMVGKRIMVKGHPLIFLVPDSTPEWLKNRSFGETKSLCVSHVREAISRFRERIHVWDVINEAHVQPDIFTNKMAGFTREQNVELTVAALRAARETDPTCYRVVNSTGTWTDYYMGRKPEPWQQSVYDYLAMVSDAGGDYEAVGLQYYHSGRDMLEFERNLETFQGFGKAVHLTEAGISSSSEDVPKTEWWGGGIGGARFVWHGTEFAETSQADWFEQFYTIAYSKPWIFAVSTWDLADPAFIPHGGVVREDGSPKESYVRLAALLRGWREMA